MCYPGVYHLQCISCRYPPLINKKYNADDVETFIVNAVCVEYDVNRYQLKSKGRKSPSREARQVAMSLTIHFLHDKRLKELGKFYNRDHSTVIYAREKVVDFCFSDRRFKARYDKLLAQIQNYINTLKK